MRGKQTQDDEYSSLRLSVLRLLIRYSTTTKETEKEAGQGSPLPDWAQKDDYFNIVL